MKSVLKVCAQDFVITVSPMQSKPTIFNLIITNLCPNKILNRQCLKAFLCRVCRPYSPHRIQNLLLQTY